MSSIGISLLGTRIDLPQTAERTQLYFEQAKAAEKLEGFDKHYQATSYLLMGMASSFFNSITYTASALLESALILPLDSEEAKNNFFDKGTNALNSLAYFAAGVFMTIGAIFSPDHVLEVILPSGHAVGPEPEPTEVSISINGTKVDLPDSAKTTKTYFEKAKAAEKLDGFSKHYQATAYLLLGVAASFFNILAYGASAIFESALIAPLGSEEAKENFEEQGFNALNSIAYVAAGAILTIGALFVPDQALDQITVINPHLPPPRDGQPDPVPLQHQPVHVPFVNPDQHAQELWMVQLLEAGRQEHAALHEQQRIQEAFVMVSGAFQRFESRDDIGEDVHEIMGEYYMAVFGAEGQRQPTQADLPAMKALLAQIIFYNDYEDKFRDVLPHIQIELDQVKVNFALGKAALVEQRQIAADLRAAQILEDQAILEEQRLEQVAMRLRDEQAHVFGQEKAAWQVLLDQAQGHHDELAAHVEALEVYERAWNGLMAKKGVIGTKRELNHWINQSEQRAGVFGNIPVVNQAAVTREQCDAIAIQYADEEYSQLANVETDRQALHQALKELGVQIQALNMQMPGLLAARQKWIAIKAHLDTLAEDTTQVDIGLLN